MEELSGETLRSLPEKYRWEIRKVTQDGFVSFDGARYGIPWQYAGREVRVRICGDTFEAYDGEVRMAAHRVEYASGGDRLAERAIFSHLKPALTKADRQKAENGKDLMKN